MRLRDCSLQISRGSVLWLSRWLWRGPQKVAGLNVEHRGQTKSDGTRRGNLSNLCVKLSRFLGTVRVRIFNENVDGFSELGRCSHSIALPLKYVSQKFKKGDTAGSCSQILPQQRFSQPIILSFNCFTCEGFKSLPCGDKAAEPKMERGKESASLGVLRIECEELLESGRR